MTRSAGASLLPLVAAGCLLGADPDKGAAAPALLGVRLVSPVDPPGDALAWAREGTHVEVEITTRHAFDPAASEVTLGGYPMAVVAQDNATTARFALDLTGDEESSPKAVTGTLRDAKGAATRFSSEPLVETDFRPPAAGCILSPRVANVTRAPTLIVTPSEALLGGPPQVTIDPPLLTAGEAVQLEGQWVFPITGPVGQNVEDYVVRVTGTDLAGNTQAGDSFCLLEDRTGTFLGRGPALPPGTAPVVTLTPSRLVEEVVDGQPVLVPRGGLGAQLVVTLPTVDPIVPGLSTVSLSGLELDHLGDDRWGRTLDGTEGEGLKTLEARLLDAAENELRDRRPAVVRFDFTPPSADCVLQPKAANAQQAVQLDVFLSEPVQGGAPVVTADHADVEVVHEGSVGTQHTYRVRLTRPGNADYLLSVPGIDLAGNLPAGPLCGEAERRGTIRGVPPVVDGLPEIVIDPSVRVDEGGRDVPRARQGARITVHIPTVDSIAPRASEVRLSGTALPWDETLGRFATTLSGSEVEGLQTLDARLVDPAGNETRASWPDVARFDLTPPFADCVLVPALARAGEEAVFQVFASEALQGGAPDVQADVAGVEVRHLGSEGTQHSFGVRFPAGGIVDPYVLTATGMDLAGNPQANTSFCEAARRTGRYDGELPRLVGTPQLTVEPSVSGDPGDPLPHAREGATLTLAFPLDDDVDHAASTVTVGDVPLTWTGGDTWVGELTSAAGDGTHLLDAHLVDAAGNEVRLRSADLASPLGLVADFTPPSASCLLSPPVANAATPMRLDVFPSEELGAAPLITPSDGRVTVTHVGTSGRAHRFTVSGPEDTDLEVSLVARGRDLVGNATSGDTLCAPAEVSGELRRRGPHLAGDGLTVEAEPSTSPDGRPWVRAGATVTVTVQTEDAVDLAASSVRLGTITLAPAGGATWVHTFTGAEEEGDLRLDVRLVDDVGNVLDLVRPAAVRTDFTPPRATCLLLPEAANADDTIVLQVQASEPLAEPWPDAEVVPDSLVAGVRWASADRRAFELLVEPRASEDAKPYVVSIRGRDLADNPQEGSSLCAVEERTGELDLTPPSWTGLVMSADTWKEDGAWQLGAHSTVSLSGTLADEDLDLQASYVAFGGVRLQAQPDDQGQWSYAMTGAEGQGRWSLDALLVDRAGNETRILRPDLALRVDLTGPEVIYDISQRYPAFASYDRIYVPGDADWIIPLADTHPFTGSNVLVDVDVLLDEGAEPGTLILTSPTHTVRIPSRRPYPSDLALFRFDPDEDLPAHGLYEMTIEVEDLLGNVGLRRLRELVDYRGTSEAPGAQVDPVGDARAATWMERAPWGFLGGSPAARYHLHVAGPPASTPWAWVRVTNGAGSFLAERVDPTPGEPIDLDFAQDPGAEIWIEPYDRWGLPGPRRRVRDHDHVARTTLDVPSSPHAFQATTRYPARPFTPWPEVGVGTGTHRTRAGPRWEALRWEDPPDVGTEGGMAWDPSTDRVVAFGGRRDGALGGTASWDGRSWLAWTGGGPSPSPRWGLVLVPDPVHGGLVLFGGTDGSPKGDTWVWQDGAWSVATCTLPDQPAPRSHAAAAWSRAFDRVVLFGGDAGTGPGAVLDDLWSWNPPCWEPILPEPGAPWPSARRGAVFAGDGTFEPLLAGGESSDGTALDEAWRLTVDGWELGPDEGIPEGPVGPRTGHAMAWDPAWNREILMGGGAGPGDRSNVVYQWTSDFAYRWQEISTPTPPAGRPAARRGALLAYDRVREQVLLFGGEAADTGDLDTRHPQDTWTWDGDRWTQVTPRRTRPGPRTGPAVAPHQGGLLLVGGDDVGTKQGDAWQLDARGWQDLGAPLPGEGRAHPTCAVDPMDGSVWLLGGEGSGGDLDEAWRFLGGAWSSVSSLPSGASAQGAGAWDAAEDRLVVVGATGAGTSTWAWDGAWGTLGDAPGAASRGALVWDDARQELLLVGGASGPSGPFLAGTWALEDDTWTLVDDGTEGPSPRWDALVAWDPDREVVVLAGGRDAAGPRTDVWTWDGLAWTQEQVEGQGPAVLEGARGAHADLFDGVVLVDADEGGIWRLDLGASAQAAHRVSLDWEAVLGDLPADARSGTEPDALTVRWIAGGVGHPDGATDRGTQLLVGWDRGWRSVATSTGGPDNPREICRTGRADDDLGICSVKNSVLRNPTLFGPLGAQRLELAMRSEAKGGVRVPGKADGAYAELVTEGVEVRLRYLLPEEP